MASHFRVTGHFETSVLNDPKMVSLLSIYLFLLLSDPKVQMSEHPSVGENNSILWFQQCSNQFDEVKLKQHRVMPVQVLN